MRSRPLEKYQLASPLLTAGAAFRANRFFCLIFGDSFGGFFQERRRELHWLQIGTPTPANSVRDFFEPFQGSWGKREQPPLSPTWIRWPTTTRRHTKASVNVRQELHRSKVAARGSDLSSPFRAKRFRDLVHVEPGLHFLFAKITNCEVLVADHQAHLSLPSLTPQLFAELSKLAEIQVVFEIVTRRIAMDDH
jgi:hypothetical protein